LLIDDWNVVEVNLNLEELRQMRKFDRCRQFGIACQILVLHIVLLVRDEELARMLSLTHLNAFVLGVGL